METVETLEAAAGNCHSANARDWWRDATVDPDPEVEGAWATEVLRRQTEIESGAVFLLPGPEKLDELRAESQSSICGTVGILVPRVTLKWP
jgi:hypothetical protein